MKKIFAYILAVAAFASCATDVNDVVNANTTLTAPMEISIDESRVFDAELNWSWENSDMILGYQKAGNNTANILTLNENGNFYNAAFEFATTDPASFYFIYPLSAFSANGLTVEQTGVWSPVLYGVAENAVVANIGTVTMNYLSSAFEVRVWDNGRAARKNIVKAVVTSENDFVPYWDLDTYTQSLSGKEMSLDLNGDTAIFNLGEGDFVFTLTLTDTEGETLSWELPSKNFAAGKRTILNVEWKKGVSVSLDGANSWYEEVAAGNANSNLEGGYIYIGSVTAEGGDAVVYVDGVAANVVDGKVAATSGTHTVYAAIGDVKSAEYTVTVTKRPELTYTVYSSYNSNDGSVSKNNSYDGRTIYAKNFAINDSVLNVTSVVFYYGSASQATSVGGTATVSSLGLGNYNCYAVATIDINGTTVNATTSTTAIAVTGIPYTMNVSANDSWNAWTENGNVKWNESSSVRLGYNLEDWSAATSTSIEKSFFLPANIVVVVNSTGTVTGSGSKVWLVDSRVNTTFTLSVSGATAYSVSSTNGGTEQDYSSGNKTATMTSASPVVRLHNSYSTASGCTKVKSLTIKYQ